MIAKIGNRISANFRNKWALFIVLGSALAIFVPLDNLIPKPEIQNTMEVEGEIIIQSKSPIEDGNEDLFLLFEVERKPPQSKPAENPVQTSKPMAGWQITGIMQLKPDLIFAWVRTPGNKPVKVTLGNEIEGWTVAEITPQTIVFVKDKIRQLLEVSNEKKH